MINVSNDLKNIFYQSNTVNIGAGCTIEYNMNEMIEDVAVSTNISDSTYKNTISLTTTINPFSKLFPIDSVIRPNRPVNPGIKYYILRDTDHSGKLSDYKNVPFSTSMPRVYYPGSNTAYKYWITPAGTGVNLTLQYPTKAALSNKIVVKFEKYHSLPSSCTLTITYSDNTTATPTLTVPSSGTLDVYFNGTSWSLTPPFSSSQPISYPAPKSIKSIVVTTPSVSGGIIGIIEVSARWIKDISSDLISFDIEKESSSNLDDILPVGNITANSASVSLAKYNQSNLMVLEYNSEDAWDASPNDIVYLYQNAEIKPHIKVYHAAGEVTEGSLKYSIVPQGTFYINSFSISEYGDSTIEALDGAKYLMETISPDLICTDAPVVSVIMTLLDSVGFTNYNINVNTPTDESIPTCTYWWTEDNTSVWTTLQDLCRDMQINAFFDENNILQIYTRDKIYQNNATQWQFNYSNDGSNLSNIVSFNKKDIPAANQIKIVWRVPMNSAYTRSSRDLWSSEPSFLIAGGLKNSITSGQTVEQINSAGFSLNIWGSTDPYFVPQTSFNYNGYFLVDSEIFEYDAIEFQYEPLNSSTPVTVFIANEGDLQKNRVLSKAKLGGFIPTGKFRIKNRAVFGTVAANHSASAISSDWQQVVEDQWN